MPVRLLEIDRPTGKGITYPRMIIENIITEWITEKSVNKMCIFKDIHEIRDDVIGIAENLHIDIEGYLVADISLDEDKCKEIFKDKSGKFSIRPIGHGTVDKQGVVQEGYWFSGLCIRHAPMENKNE